MHACTLRYTFNLVCLEVRYSARSGFLLSHSSKDRAFNMSNNRSKHLISVSIVSGCSPYTRASATE